MRLFDKGFLGLLYVVLIGDTIAAEVDVTGLAVTLVVITLLTVLPGDDDPRFIAHLRMLIAAAGTYLLLFLFLFAIFSNVDNATVTTTLGNTLVFMLDYVQGYIMTFVGIGIYALFTNTNIPYFCPEPEEAQS